MEIEKYLISPESSTLPTEQEDSANKTDMNH